MKVVLLQQPGRWLHPRLVLWARTQNYWSYFYPSILFVPEFFIGCLGCTGRGRVALPKETFMATSNSYKGKLIPVSLISQRYLLLELFHRLIM